MTKGTWTDDRLVVLKAMAEAGKTAQEIADRLGGGISRNAVLGKMDRLGINNKQSGRSVIAKKKTAPAPKLVELVDDEQPSPDARSLLEMRPGRCYFGIGDPHKPTFHFCGRKTPDKTENYCPGHAAKAYQKTRKFHVPDDPDAPPPVTDDDRDEIIHRENA